MSKESRFISPEIPGKSVGVSAFLAELRPTGLVLQGGLNINRQYVDAEGRSYLHRAPKERGVVVDSMLFSYHTIGFTAHGGAFRYLDTAEQLDKMDYMHRLGLKTIVPIVAEGEEMVVPFLEGEMLQKYLQGGKTRILPDVLDHMVHAHDQGVIFGDRWTSNTLVSPEEDFTEIDFDVELTGKSAKEFELSQFLYHAILFSKSRPQMIGLLDNYFSQRRRETKSYDKTTIAAFLQGHLDVYDGQVYDGSVNNIREEVEQVSGILI